jgi:hypothetical protein
MFGSKQTTPPPAGNTPPQVTTPPPAGSTPPQVTTPPPAGSTAPPVVKKHRYICTESCTYNKRYYREGDTLTPAEKKEVPHFKLAEEDT